MERILPIVERLRSRYLSFGEHKKENWSLRDHDHTYHALIEEPMITRGPSVRSCPFLMVSIFRRLTSCRSGRNIVSVVNRCYRKGVMG